MNISESIHIRLKRLFKRIELLLLKYQRSYLSFVFLFAITGYVLILVFPLLAYMASENTYKNLIDSQIINWQDTLIWFAIAMFAIMFCYRYLRYKPASPAGLTISAEKLPEIFKLVEKINQHFKRPAIHRIIISTHYELDIIKTPRWALPVWSNNTLVIGLPLLLCFSPQQFECMMGRRLGQFSKNHNIITNWLYQLRASWKQYAFSYGKQKYPDSMILKWLFSTYSFLYSALSIYVVRTEELNADSYAMELFNHEDIREMMTADAVYRHYLDTNFWPAVNKTALPIVNPHRKLSSIIHKILQGDKLAVLTNKVFTTSPEWNSPYPSLQLRLEKIAHDTPYMPEQTDVTAASQYLGKSQSIVIDLMDKLWLKQALLKRKKTSHKNNSKTSSQK